MTEDLEFASEGGSSRIDPLRDWLIVNEIENVTMARCIHLEESALPYMRKGARSRAESRA